MISAKTTASATCENGGSIDNEIDDIDAFYLRKMTSAFLMQGKGKFCCDALRNGSYIDWLCVAAVALRPCPKSSANPITVTPIWKW